MTDRIDALTNLLGDALVADSPSFFADELATAALASRIAEGLAGHVIMRDEAMSNEDLLQQLSRARLRADTCEWHGDADTAGMLRDLAAALEQRPMGTDERCDVVQRAVHGLIVQSGYT